MKKIFDYYGSEGHYSNWTKVLLTMRITTFLLFIGVMDLLSVPSYSQNTKVSLDMKNASIEDVLSKIEDSSEFYFLFNQKLIDVSRKVDVKADRKPIKDILSEVFADDVNFIVYDRQIILTPRYGAADAILFQQQKVTGIVTDAASGEPIAGVNVFIQGTTVGAISDVNGRFSFPTTNQNVVVVFSFIGYVTQKVAFSGQAEITVALEAELTNLEEVVVVGYGTMRRQNFTGSVSTLKVTESPAALTPSTNALDFLRGTTPGVTMTQSGEAGAAPNLQVRGQRSLSTNASASAPLIVLDGVIFQGSLNNIDPNIIETMSVLKDATSLAAYGSMAANGVVMVTTKKGQIGKPMINFSSYVALSNPNYRPTMRDAAGYIELMNARTGLAPGADPAWMNALQRDNYEAGRITDWYDYITQQGVMQNYSMNVSGGTADMTYLVGGSHTNENNFVKGDQYIRNTFNARLTTKVNKYISVGANLNQAFNTFLGIRPAYGAAVTLTPYGSPTLSDGVRMRKYVDDQETTTENPMWNVTEGRSAETKATSTVIGGEINVKIPWIEGLSYKITGSYTNGGSKEMNFTSEKNSVNLALGEAGYTTAEQDKYLNLANGSIIQMSNKSWVLDNIITYTKDFGEHNINSTLVYTRDSRLIEGTTITGTDFSAVGNTTLGVYGLPNAGTQNISSINYTLQTDVGYLARINYSFKNTYHLNASVRRDGSSVFGSENKWGTFPAFGAAWTISNNSFMKSISWINNLKLKASWGKNGNQSLAPYGTLSRMSIGRTGGIAYLFNNTTYWGQSLSTLGNNLLGWETTTSFNYGIESDFLKNRIHFEVEAYKSITTDQIFNRTIPVMGAGITTQSATMGRIDNWGVESVLGITTINQSGFTWNTGFIFSLNRNKLVELYGDGQDDIPNNRFLGKSLGAIYGYKWIGVVQAEDTEYITANGAKPGDAMYANIDASADGRITATDREILGYSRESYRLSMTNTLAYKNFQLYFMFNGIFGDNKNGYGLAVNNMAYLSYEGYQNRNTLDHPFWTVDNLSTEYPAVGFSDTRFTALESYSFVRLQNVNLSYTFPKALTQKIKLSSLRAYVTGENLWFYAPHWTGSDPEVRNYSAAQLARTFTIGINVGF